MKYDLVFEGGGAKGMVFVGALQEFEARGHGFERLLGTSAGAITATFLAAGYSPREMLESLDERDDEGRPVFARFMGTPEPFSPDDIKNSATRAFLDKLDLPFVPNFLERRFDNWLAETLLSKPSYRNLFSFIERGGWYSADEFPRWLRRKLDEGEFQGKKRDFAAMNLREFRAATGRDLSLVASDTTAERMVVLNQQTAPDLPLVWAVRMSMGIPLLWPEVEWQSAWGSYRGRDMSGHLMVDGGLLSNFPIELFVSDAPQVTALMGEKRSQRVLGFLIDETRKVAGIDVASTASGLLAGLQLVKRLGRLINTVTGAHDKMVIEAFDELVIRLPARGYGTTEFDMSDERRTALVSAGRAAMGEYLTRLETSPTSFVDDGFDPVDAFEHADRVATRLLDW